MNRFVVFFILTSVAAFAEVRVKGKIDSVIVFSDRALVKRVQPLEGLEKTGTLRFIDLPQALLGDSVRASATGATVTAVSLRKIEKLYGEEWDEHPLKKKIIRFEADIHHEKDNLETYRDQLKVLDQMMKLTTAQTDKEARVGVLNIDSWDKALVFLDAKKQRYREKIRKSEDVLQTLHKELSKTTIEFNAVTQAAKTSGIEVEVSYAKTDETAKIELEYLVNNVSWIARYDLRGSAEGNEFQLVSHAIIRQSTGEAWKQAKITLSTARPSTSMTPGILTPWRVDAHEFSSPTAKKQSSGRRLEGESTTIADEAMAETASESTDASETTSVSITLPTRENILSDNADHRVTLGTSALKGTLTHVAVPSLSQYVYLKARLKNMSSAPMVGTMNAFLDGSYIGNVTLKVPAAVGEEFDVFLGPDQRMQLKRTLKRGDVEKSGLFGSKVEIINQWEIEVANFTKKPRQVLVYDQYPISADPNIATRYNGASRNEDTKDANGILSWKIDLKAGEKTKFDFTYALTFPKETWERFSQGYNNEEAQVQQFYQNSSSKQNVPAAQRSYNLEKMLRK